MSPLPVPADPGRDRAMIIVNPHDLRRRDSLIALGLFGMHTSVAVIALIVAVLPEPHYSWHYGLAAVVFAAGLVPLIAAVLLWRHARRVYARVQAQHARRALGGRP